MSALDDVVNVEDVRRIGELDADAGEDRHQTLVEGLELLPRIPDLADLKVAIRTEADVVVEPGGYSPAFSSWRIVSSSFLAVRVMGLKRTTILMI